MEGRYCGIQARFSRIYLLKYRFRYLNCARKLISNRRNVRRIAKSAAVVKYDLLIKKYVAT